MSVLERLGTPINHRLAYGYHGPDGRLLGVVDPSKSLYVFTGLSRRSTNGNRCWITFLQQEWDFIQGHCSEIEYVLQVEQEFWATSTADASRNIRPVKARFRTDVVLGIPATALDVFDAEGNLIRKAH